MTKYTGYVRVEIKKKYAEALHEQHMLAKAKEIAQYDDRWSMTTYRNIKTILEIAQHNRHYWHEQLAAHDQKVIRKSLS